MTKDKIVCSEIEDVSSSQVNLNLIERGNDIKWLAFTLEVFSSIDATVSTAIDFHNITSAELDSLSNALYRLSKNAEILERRYSKNKV